MVSGAEQQNINSPLLERTANTDDVTVGIEMQKSTSNHIGSIDTPLNNETYPTLSNDSVFKTLSISFQNISYTIGSTKAAKKIRNWKQRVCCRQQTTSRQILFDLSGIFTPGMNAILGPTGCGKSTLLDILADRKDTMGLSGHVFVAGRPRSAHFKYTVGYVTQDDIMCETLTVRENLMFSANIRLPRSFTAQQRIERVNQVIRDLDLHSCLDTFIGTDFVRGVSGGEKKRTNIGMELVLAPKILFLDEPTTGLDASTAKHVMHCLHNLSRQGRTIIFSIHQPRYSIFRLFDTVLFLSAGRTIYTGSPANVIDYFSGQGFKYEEHENPADYVLDILIESSAQSSKQLEAAYLNSRMHSNILSTMNLIADEHEPQSSDGDVSTFDPTAPQLHTTEFYCLAQRTLRNAVRNPALAASQTMIAVLLALLTGLLFNSMKATIDPGVQNRLGAIFFLASHQVLCTASALEPLIKERSLFIHENASGYYRVSTFFLTKVVFDLIPMRAVPSLIFSMITYPLTGFQRSWTRFFIFFVTVFVSSMYGSALCFFIAACIPIFAVALSMTILTLSTTMVVSGFLVDLESVFSFLQWIKWISAIRYSSNLLTINEFTNLTFCFSNSTQICPLHGEQVLLQRHIAHDTEWDKWKNLLAILIMAIVLFFMAYIQLLRIKKMK